MSITSSSKSGVGLVGQTQGVALRRAYPTDPAVDGFAQWASDQALQAEAFQNAIDALDTNPAFTAIGRAQQVRTRVVTRLAEVATERKARVGGLDTRIADTQRAALTPTAPSTEDPVVRFLRHREIRDRFAALTDGVDKRTVVDRAVREGDTDTLAALAAAPKSFPAVDPAVLTKAREQMAEVANPELVRLQALREAHAAVLAVAEQEARAVLARYGLSLDTEPAT